MVCAERHPLHRLPRGGGSRRIVTELTGLDEAVRRAARGLPAVATDADRYTDDLHRYARRSGETPDDAIRSHLLEQAGLLDDVAWARVAALAALTLALYWQPQTVIHGDRRDRSTLAGALDVLNVVDPAAVLAVYDADVAAKADT